MTTTTFFIIFIPILSIILLFINLILAPHNPYQEKDSAFECGFHSFLGQNRTQFSVSFFIFGLLFLLFDLEILLVYPYSVSGYNNDVYGLVIMLVFFVLLTLGFIFELGKNALSIESKQTALSSNNDVPNIDVFSVFVKKSLLLSGFLDNTSFKNNNTLYGLKFFSLIKQEKYGDIMIIIYLTVITILLWLFAREDSVICDAPRAWGLYFQDSASPQMEALVELHDNIMYYLVAILFSVGWIQGAIIKNFDSSKSPISNKYLNHGTLIELIWTITPALILVLIAFPSFKLLYLMDEVTDPSLSVLAEGHQWYWSYEYPDFLNSDGDFVEFDSYLVPESDLEKGGLRMLEVDNRVILPEITHTRFILTAADVIHSFAIPALGVKCDAYPGRLNQFSVLINRLGTFYGQCSEICGILHSSMPIVVESVSIVKFLYWLQEQ